MTARLITCLDWFWSDHAWLSVTIMCSICDFVNEKFFHWFNNSLILFISSYHATDSLIPQVPQNLFYTTLSPTSLFVLWKYSQTSNERVVPPIGFRIVLRKIFAKKIVTNLFVEFATNKTNYTMELQGLGLYYTIIMSSEIYYVSYFMQKSLFLIL